MAPPNKGKMFFAFYFFFLAPAPKARCFPRFSSKNLSKIIVWFKENLGAATAFIYKGMKWRLESGVKNESARQTTFVGRLLEVNHIC